MPEGKLGTSAVKLYKFKILTIRTILQDFNKYGDKLRKCNPRALQQMQVWTITSMNFFLRSGTI